MTQKIDQYLRHKHDWDVSNVVDADPSSFPEVEADLLGNSEFLSRLHLREGVKSSTRLEKFRGDLSMQSLEGCNGTPDGAIEFYDEKLEVEPIYVGIKFCNEDLVGKETEVLLAAGLKRQNSELPMRDVLMAYLTKKTRQKMQNLVINGDTTSLNPDLKHFDGMRKQMLDVSVNVYNSAEIAITNQNAYPILQGMFTVIPTEMADNGETVSFIVGTDTARKIIFSWNAINPYNLINMPSEQGSFTFALPILGMEVVAVPELNGTQEVYATNLDYWNLGTDLESDFELDIVHDAIKDELIVQTKFRLGLKGVEKQRSTRLVLATS